MAGSLPRDPEWGGRGALPAPARAGPPSLHHDDANAVIHDLAEGLFQLALPLSHRAGAELVEVRVRRISAAAGEAGAADGRDVAQEGDGVVRLGAGGVRLEDRTEGYAVNDHRLVGRGVARAVGPAAAL